MLPVFLIINNDKLIQSSSMGMIDKDAWLIKGFQVQEIDAESYRDGIVGSIFQSYENGVLIVDPPPSEYHKAAYGAWTLQDDGHAKLWATIRVLRDNLLKSTDWTQLADAPLSAEQKERYRLWRVSVRDFPSRYSVEQAEQAYTDIKNFAGP